MIFPSLSVEPLAWKVSRFLARRWVGETQNEAVGPWSGTTATATGLSPTGTAPERTLRLMSRTETAEPPPSVTYPWSPSGVIATPVAPGKSSGAPIGSSIPVSIWVREPSAALAAVDEGPARGGGDPRRFGPDRDRRSRGTTRRRG